MTTENENGAEPNSVPSKPSDEEATLRARISAWLSKRPLSSVIVASALAFLLGLGVAGAVMHKDGDRDHGHFGWHMDDRDGRGPGMMPGGPKFGGPGGQDDRGPGMMPDGPGMGGPGELPTPLPTSSATTQ